MASATLVFMLVCGALLTAHNMAALVAVAITGGANVYMMVNPAKSSYSIAPTMPVCIVLGLLTVWMFAADRAWQRVLLAGATGFLVGVATDLRLSSAAALACGLVVFLFAVISPALARKSPPGSTTISHEPNAVIWTGGESWQNPTARALEIYLDRHAVAEFDTAPAETVDALLASIAKDGHPQYFVIQNPGMDAIAKRAAALGRVEDVG